MRKMFSTVALAAVLALCAIPDLYAQQFVLNDTTLSGAVTATQQTVTLASASAKAGSTVGAPAVGHGLFVDGEFMIITSVPTTGTTFGVRRAAAQGQIAQAHATAAVVLTGPAGYFKRVDPGYEADSANKVCTASTVPKPWVNIANGNVFVCLSSVWSGTNTRVITYNSINLN